MNNDQFRRLAFGGGAAAGAQKDAGNSSSSGALPGRTAGVLGSRQKPSMPMTPVSRVAFARQLAERFQDEEKQKKFRTSTPKGSKFAAGYVDRAKLRTSQEEQDDRAARLAVLEERYKKGGVDRATYDRLRLEIAGGDVASTHLVKGLDFKLLERVRQGEDVLGAIRGDNSRPATEEADAAADGSEGVEAVEGAKEDDGDEGEGAEGSADDELERLEEAQVQAVARDKTKKRGQLAPTALVPGQKRTRDQILAELKAARAAAKEREAAASALGSRFKKIGAPQQAGSRIERDSRGREVLVIVDEDGHEKRKVRKVAASVDGDGDGYGDDGDDGNDTKNTNGVVLGMEVPEYYRKKQEAEAAAAAAKEVDIFDDVESDYDPLAGVDSGSSDESESESSASGQKAKETAAPDPAGEESEEAERRPRRRRPSSAGSRDGEAGKAAERPAPAPAPAPALAPSGAAPRKGYFGSAKLLSEEASRGGASLDDPSVLAALRKARQMREAAASAEKSKEAEQEAAQEARLKKLLQSGDRDAADLDMGFGTNRLEDEEDLDEDGERIKLSTWNGGGGGGGDDGEAGGSRGGGGGAKRKRGGKKRKGDGNNAADVLRVLEKRREAGA